MYLITDNMQCERIIEDVPIRPNILERTLAMAHPLSMCRIISAYCAHKLKAMHGWAPWRKWTRENGRLSETEW